MHRQTRCRHGVMRPCDSRVENEKGGGVENDPGRCSPDDDICVASGDRPCGGRQRHQRDHSLVARQRSDGTRGCRRPLRALRQIRPYHRRGPALWSVYFLQLFVEPAHRPLCAAGSSHDPAALLSGLASGSSPPGPGLPEHLGTSPCGPAGQQIKISQRCNLYFSPCRLSTACTASTRLASGTFTCASACF